MFNRQVFNTDETEISAHHCLCAKPEQLFKRVDISGGFRACLMDGGGATLYGLRRDN